MGRVGWRPNPSSLARLLDTYVGVTAAYSLRKLSSSYSGPAITVRRSGDNISQDIGFNANGTLDTTSLLSFVGSYNMAAYSETFDNSYWHKNDCSIVANQTIAPDGTLTADLLREGTSLWNHSLGKLGPTSYPAGTSYNASVYVKKGTGSQAPNSFAFGFGETNSSALPYVIFNISTGAVVTSGNATGDLDFGYSITDAGNGWYRCAMWGTVPATANRTQFVYVRFINNLNTLPSPIQYIGNINRDMFVWGYHYRTGLNNPSILTLEPYNKTAADTAAGWGYVTKWYDQSGNSYDRASTTAAEQPSIVSIGNLQTANGKVAMYFDGTNDSFIQQSPIVGDNIVGAGLNSTIFSVTKLDTTYLTNNEYPIFGGLANNAIRFSVLNNKWYLINTTGTGISSTGTVTSNQVISSVLFAPTDKVRINGSEVISGNVGTGGTNSYIGRSWLGKFYKGYFQEHIIYLTNQTSNMSAIEGDLNSHYGAY